MNYKKLIVLLFVICFLIIAFFSMRGVLTPYVSFQEAKQLEKYVQIIGKLEKTTGIKYAVGSISFSLSDDDNTVMRIIYSGPKPLNFEHAKQVVALGKYDISASVFKADKILTKCPSKYTKENRK
jgi:cytochrome c-type biogenesis protein CcmE